ncbi:MAG: PqqD family protein [Clostridia bacterium]|nr:PqqD family protein [Clostridia bacterium]
MKLNQNFLVHNTGTDIIIVPTGDAGFSGVVKGNKTFGAILEFLKDDTSEAEIISKMSEKYDAPVEVIEKDVRSTISRLKEIGAIDE